MYQIIFREYECENERDGAAQIVCDEVIFFIDLNLSGIDRVLDHYEKLCTKQIESGYWTITNSPIVIRIFNLSEIKPGTCICDPVMNYENDALEYGNGKNFLYADEHSYPVVKALYDREKKYNDEWIMKINENPLTHLANLTKDMNETFQPLKDMYGWSW